MPTVGVLGTFDTKGEELGWVATHIRKRGHRALLIDVGTLGSPRVRPDVSIQQLASEAGVDLAARLAARDRGQAVAAMCEVVEAAIPKMFQRGDIQALISLGGGGGTTIGCAAMRALPPGIPKVMVSTVASGNVEPFVRGRDIVMFPSILDISGLNRISRRIFAQAAGLVCGMLEQTETPAPAQKQ